MSTKRFYTITTISILAFALLIGVLSSWYTVDQSEQGVILTFGKVTKEIDEPGLHFKLPWPIQEVQKVSKETFSLVFGYVDGSGQTTGSDDAKMLTGDANIVLANLVVQWRISDVKKFLFESSDPQGILRNATSSALRGIIGSSNIDSALTDGKPEIESRVKEYLVKLIKNYEIGITIMDVKLQNVDLPNEEVRKAFTEVTDALEQQNTKINEAKKYENEKLNEAQGTAAAKLSAAEGVKFERVKRAEGDVAKFNAVYNEYVKNQGITKQRLVIETLEEILPKAEIFIMEDGASDTVKYLPLRPDQQIANQSAAQTATQGTQGGTNQ